MAVPAEHVRGLSLNRVACAIVCMCVAGVLAGPCLAQGDTDELRTALGEYLGCFRLEMMDMKRQEIAVTSKVFCLTEVYADKQPQPFWVTPEGPGPKAKLVLDFLKHAEEEGLDPANYEVEEIAALFDADGPVDLALLDALLTYNLVKYSHDVSCGSIRQPSADSKLFPGARSIEFKPRAVLEQARAAPDLAAWLADLPPAHEHYLGLKKALALYRSLEQQGGWPAVPAGEPINPGDNDTRMPLIIERLRVTDDLDPAAAHEGPYGQYSPLLVPSVMRFQRRHGLAPDGVVGKETIVAMDVPIAERIRQIIVNMTRWRWQDRVLGEKYVLVNIAGFTLSAFEAGQEHFSFPVIVGEFQHQTPVFSDRIEYIVINPHWTVPKSIARNEELPDLRKDPRALMKRRIRLFSGWSEDAPEIDSTAIDWHNVSPAMMDQYRLRQDPGPANALGRLKFVFPNPYRVYLHDTPTHKLFARNKRDFSHGCIRVSDPVGLAAFVLSGEQNGWTPQKITNAIEKEERMVIKLADPLPVHITYQTARFDKEGIVCFNNDVYGRDEKLYKVLFSNRAAQKTTK